MTEILALQKQLKELALKKYGTKITVAVDTPGGLMVPNIKDVGGKNVLEIQQELMRVATAAQQGKLALNDIQGGTITLSNIGVIGTKEIFNLARHVFDVVVQIVVKIRS
eukprot:g27803.t1